MHAPLRMQDCAHLRDASGPLPVRTSSRMPPMMSSDFVVREMPAGSTLGQASTHFPHRVQASSMSSAYSARDVSKGTSFIGCMTNSQACWRIGYVRHTTAPEPNSQLASCTRAGRNGDLSPSGHEQQYLQ